MTAPVRLLTFAIGALELLLGLGFAMQASWATWLWPWVDSRLSYLFIGSILAASALAVLWAALARDLSALLPILVDSAVTGFGLGATFLVVWSRDDNRQALVQGLLFFLTAAALVVILSRMAGMPFRDRRPAPPLVRWSCAFFAAAIAFAVVALLLRAEHIFPWPLSPESSVAFGCIFIGSATFYLYAFLRPVMGNVYPQLLAFLAYDLVLIVPFLRHFSNVETDHRLSLIIYTAVIVYSGLLAVYVLFVHPTLRIETSLDTDVPAEGEVAPPALG